MVETPVFTNNNDDMFDWGSSLGLTAIPILLAKADRDIR
jgi:hypothetical protein